MFDCSLFTSQLKLNLDQGGKLLPLEEKVKTDAQRNTKNKEHLPADTSTSTNTYKYKYLETSRTSPPVPADG